MTGVCPRPVASSSRTPRQQVKHVDWIQWGTLPEWFAAIGTVGGLFVALMLFRGEAHARHQQDEDRLRDLARHVAVWWDENQALTLRNGGPEPAYDVNIYHSREEGYTEQLPLLYSLSLLPPETEIATGATVPTPMGTFMFRLVFTDARGIRWVRESGGNLIRVASTDVAKVGAMEAIRKE